MVQNGVYGSSKPAGLGLGLPFPTWFWDARTPVFKIIDLAQAFL